MSLLNESAHTTELVPDDVMEALVNVASAAGGWDDTSVEDDDLAIIDEYLGRESRPRPEFTLLIERGDEFLVFGPFESSGAAHAELVKRIPTALATDIPDTWVSAGGDMRARIGQNLPPGWSL